VGGVQRRPQRQQQDGEMADFYPKMQKGNLDAAAPDRHGRITKETVELKGVSVTRVTFGVGAKWSEDLKESAGTHSCELPHVAIVVSGTLRVVMDDGEVEDFSKNDVMLLPPGHDAWSVGDVPCVFIEFSRGNDYYRAHRH
jgi:mannose-6-phosphate isomerase-like protein (cupin superfamily)